MTSSSAARTLATILTLCVCLSAGCRYYEAPPRNYFVIETARTGPPAAGPQDGVVLSVPRLTILSAFETRQLIYRQGELEFEPDFTNEFLVAPATMITEQMRLWLGESNLFRRVLDPGSTIAATHAIEGNITALYADLRDPSKGTATIGMRLFLVEREQVKDSVVFGKTYNASFAIESRTPAAVVKAYGRCLAQILTELERDLRLWLDQRSAK